MVVPPSSEILYSSPAGHCLIVTFKHQYKIPIKEHQREARPHSNVYGCRKQCSKAQQTTHQRSCVLHHESSSSSHIAVADRRIQQTALPQLDSWPWCIRAETAWSCSQQQVAHFSWQGPVICYAQSLLEHIDFNLGYLAIAGKGEHSDCISHRPALASSISSLYVPQLPLPPPCFLAPSLMPMPVPLCRSKRAPFESTRCLRSLAWWEIFCECSSTFTPSMVVYVCRTSNALKVSVPTSEWLRKCRQAGRISSDGVSEKLHRVRRSQT